MSNDFVAALDKIADLYRIAYQVQGGEPIALEYARSATGSAIAGVLSHQLQHETTMRMVIKPDVDDATIDTIATETGTTAELVRTILGAVLAHQLPGINYIRKTTTDER